MDTPIKGELGITEFAIKRTQLILPLLGCIMFIFVCLMFVIITPEPTGPEPEEYTPWLMKLYGFVMATLFFFGAKSLLKQMTSAEPGLILTADGIIDQTSELSHGLIRWADIEGVSRHKDGKFKYVCLHVRESMHDKEPNTMLTIARAKAFMISPDSINVETSILQDSFDSIFDQVDRYHRAFQSSCREAA